MESDNNTSLFSHSLIDIYIFFILNLLGNGDEDVMESDEEMKQ